MQRRGLSLNPITTLYYIAPASLAFLSIPWFFIEADANISGDATNFTHVYGMSGTNAIFVDGEGN